MAHDSFSISEVIPAPPEEIYSAWLDTSAHSAFTGEEATVEPFVGGRHTAFGGYAEGTNLELHPGRRIVQTWRSKDFPDESPDSRVEVTLEETLGGTVVTIFHSELPSGQSDRYREGWMKNYLEALKQYFAGVEEGGSAGDAVFDAEDAESTDVTQPPPPPPPRKAASTNGAPRHTTRAAAPAKKAAARRSAPKAKAKAKAKVKAKVIAKGKSKEKKTAKKVRAAARKSPARAKTKAKGKSKRKASRPGKRRR